MDPELKEINPNPDESKWQLEKREIVHKNPWYNYVHDSGKTDTGKPFDYFFKDIGFSAAAIALTEKGKLILVRQYRYVTNKSSLEVPGGGKKEGLKPEEVVKEELLEETGYKGSHLVKIGEFDAYSGSSNDRTCLSCVWV